MDSMLYGGLIGLPLSGLIIFSIMGGWRWLFGKTRRKPRPDHILVNIRPSDTIEVDGVDFEIYRWEQSYIQLRGKEKQKSITPKSSAKDIERSIMNHHELYGLFVGGCVEINDKIYRVESYESVYFDGKKPMIMLYLLGHKAPAGYSYI